MKKLAQQGYSFIVITNQAGIARKMVSEKDLARMHQLMISKLKSEGVIVLDVYVCPHHWDDNCLCRKPKSGMFYHAQKKFDIDLTNSIFIGDQKTDRISAKNADVSYLHLNKNKSLYDLLKEQKI